VGGKLKTLVIYDIEEDRIRNKILEACKDYGLDHIQYSAFMGDLNHNRREELYKELQAMKKEGNRHSVFLLLTDIMKEGSDVLVVSDDDSIVEKAFGKKLAGNSVWIDGMLSRKKQAVPPLQKAFGA